QTKWRTTSTGRHQRRRPDGSGAALVLVGPSGVHCCLTMSDTSSNREGSELRVPDLTPDPFPSGKGRPRWRSTVAGGALMRGVVRTGARRVEVVDVARPVLEP